MQTAQRLQARKIYDIVRDLRRAGMNNLLLLSGTDDVPAPFEFEAPFRF